MYSGLCYKIAETEKEKTEAREVIEEVFVREMGYHNMKPDEYDNLALFFVALDKGRVVAALRLIPDLPARLPIERYLDLSIFRGQAAKIAEVSRWVCLKDYRNKYVTLNGRSFFKDFIIATGTTHMVIQSLLNTVDFYSRLGFSPIGKPFCDHTLVIDFDYNNPNALGMMVKVEDLRI